MGDSDVGKGAFSLVLGILPVCERARVRSHVSLGMNCSYKKKNIVNIIPPNPLN